MRIINVGACALNQTPLDWDNNTANIMSALHKARENGISVLCLPELCITGYGCEDAFFSAGTRETACEVLNEIIPHTASLLVGLGMPLFYEGSLFDVVAVVADKKLLGFAPKHNLAGDGVHYEPRWFKPWPLGARARVDFGANQVPIGDYVYKLHDITVGFEICEEAWTGRRFGAEIAKLGIDIILNPSASHFALGKHETRTRIVLEGSRAFNVCYIYANLLGNEAGRIIYDGSCLIANTGELIAATPRFSFSGTLFTSVAVDIDRARQERMRSASFAPNISEESAGIVKSDFRPKEGLPDLTRSLPPVVKCKNEEFLRSVTLGIFDYIRKSRSHGAVVSLSGGADSSAVSVLVAMSIHLAVAELGFEPVLEKFGYIGTLHGKQSNAELIRSLLTCVYQATENSSETTREAASGLAHALGADYIELNIEKLVAGYCQLVSSVPNIGSLSWEKNDIALQNIQARTRAPSVWLIANLRNALLLTTSNRSEAAVGYTTMDGDTCGGLSPIGGIDKAFLREWLCWMRDEGPKEFGNLPVLKLVTDQAPTAELRPPGSNQTDEGDLMPYTVLNTIEELAVLEKKSPLEIFALLKSHYDKVTLVSWLERFFKLWARNQWKRERYAPSFHLDDENLDPKTWCRFPILSGGYKRDLERLKGLVDEL